MNFKKIKYLAHYKPSNCDEKRKVSLAACTVIEYMIETLNNIGYEVDVISAANSHGGNCYRGSKIKFNSQTCITLLSGYSAKNIVFRKILNLLFKTNYLFYLLKKLKCGETVIVYHSLSFLKIIRVLKKIKKINLILEVNEIYGDALQSPKIIKKEQDFFELADAFVFSTQMLNEKVNKRNKPFVVSNGTYRVEEEKCCKFNDGKIHIVYAGTFDQQKGGASASASAGEFLDGNYHIHILGFGTENDKQNLLNKIEQVNLSSECIVTYDGCLSGEEYIKFIQSCHIGLSTQNPDAAFNATSFPSKILSYMSNGLRVVSIRIPAVETSAVGKYVYFYNVQTPENIAKTIRNIDFSLSYDSRALIRDLDTKFIADMNTLLHFLNPRAKNEN